MPRGIYNRHKKKDTTQRSEVKQTSTLSNTVIQILNDRKAELQRQINEIDYELSKNKLG